MTAMSNFLEDEILDHILRNEAYVSAATVYVALFNSAIDVSTTLANLEAGTVTDEVATAGTAYGRVAYGASLASGGSTSNAADVNFTTATASWGEVTCVAIMDNDVELGGNVLFAGALTIAKTVNSADTFKFLATQLVTNID